MIEQRLSDLDQDLAWVSKYLPHQGTLQHFVHHNPLEAFEEYEFETACVLANKLYQGFSFLEQKKYLEYIALGKISKKTLEEELKMVCQNNHLKPHCKIDLFLNLILNPPELSVKNVIKRRLKKEPEQNLIQEIMTRVQALELPAEPENSFTFPTYKEIILQRYGVDIDDVMNPLLAKLFSSYVDPGSTYWKNEYKSKGLWHCFKENYKSPLVLENLQAKKIHEQLKLPVHKELSVDELILYYLREMAVPAEQHKTYLLSMGLRLRGWASLFNKLEHDPEQILDDTQYSIKEFLLVKLVYEYVISKAFLPQFEPHLLSDFRESQSQLAIEQAQYELTWLALHFLKQNQLIKQGQWLASEQDKENILSLLPYFTKVRRQIIYQNALEKTYAYQCLSALTLTNQKPKSESLSQSFQYITCIDDREESLRRYLEEVDPRCRTFGVAGHFEMNMHFKGFNEVRFRKLCPGVIKETFKVREVEVLVEEAAETASWMSRLYAKIFHTYSWHSRISFFSYLITVITGYLSAIPFFIKVFMPHLDLALRRSAKKKFLHQKHLVDLIFHEQGNAEGISYDQGAEKVYNLLRTIDLMDNFTEFIYVVGHGSSSINNPHEYAYNCGACGGGKGRPNGRVFATIGNHPEVRALLKSKYGIEIPDTTLFVGGYHDTCKDNISWFDSMLNAEQKARHLKHTEKMTQALKLNAAERSRKFFNISNELDPEVAFEKVATRSNDLTEARPEYNHATNALCIIGRRSFTQNLFLDRRSFLCSYNPENDEGSVLSRIMGAAVPVCAGINLEYYFSAVDPEVYGCGSKLNHNITNNYAVMSGFASDLRLGLSKQMVEIHDPRRILIVIESKPAIIEEIMANNLQLKRLIKNHWVRLMVFDFEQKEFYFYQGQSFIKASEIDSELNAYQISQEIKVDAQNLIPVAILEGQYV
ncbi:hypothetical protein COW36_15155 [bacterium (Candidatus Blackallbacteria) CG17_big_fil_post_rev_8_21_14_2_50_48_46]|uniref:Uncharacterized protein n=1 Tax=bacterium (Candidatus Blackallbacteria) CG17_big_fil_post_rev_8_21_14_2_50_48_46 TaxID=2014261 RepID=A0A2M7G2L9_9BACT|nr:MAG: hypothetical protein COW64_11395 [bacterium (Candidatus Blackallbacteria) CG18_big_fil_WC_8_21_14_2_50_49_26]PIW16048.1 MAG: hypothetical protein COW36_15155 [bacterium (Candidatus Blackallbacteria) CG17_big_fil_post_rev_8_21_14_2_50_48_46]PIW50460.1 MAG: hypothetical protein COW20_02870 [bacterium (Candidatus Blackallbacteria) CG13_big_fil_rev_8_21_14_2_50_49_14]